MVTKWCHRKLRFLSTQVLVVTHVGWLLVGEREINSFSTHEFLSPLNPHKSHEILQKPSFPFTLTNAANKTFSGTFFVLAVLYRARCLKVDSPTKYWSCFDYALILTWGLNYIYFGGKIQTRLISRDKSSFSVSKMGMNGVSMSAFLTRKNRGF